MTDGLASCLQTGVVGVPGGAGQDSGGAALVHHQDLELCPSLSERGFDIGKRKRLVEGMAVGPASGQADDPVAVVNWLVALAIMVSGSD